MEQQDSLSLHKTRLKRRWQMGLRRYVVEQIPSEKYAPYFGLDSKRFRSWIEIQFIDELNWENFGKNWQFDHIVPVAFFDLESDTDLKLCWNFINIRVEKIELNKTRGNRIDVLSCKNYFLQLYKSTQYGFCKKILDKLESLEVTTIESSLKIENFINQHKKNFEEIASLSNEEFNMLNQGVLLENILLEREILKKFGN